jgi:hypothetical protein
MAKATTPSCAGLLLLNGDNAFSELDRQPFFNIIAAKCPLLYPLVQLL